MTPAEARATLLTCHHMLERLRSELTADPRGAAVAYELGRAVGALRIALEHLNDRRSDT